MSKYRTEPDHQDTGWPKGVPYIIGNEGCERFSFYGMKQVLQLYLTSLFAVQAGVLAEVPQDVEVLNTIPESFGNEATSVVHLFVTGVYGFGMIGAILADRLLGKYRTIMYLSLVYCLGHALLAIFEGQPVGLYAGLACIAIGSGGIKPCVSAHVGDQFGRGNWFRVERIFQAFYWIINFGSFFATILIPWIRTEYGYSVAFAIPGILMGIATVFFWMGRKVFIHVPAKPGGFLGFLDFMSGSLMFLGALGWLFHTFDPWWLQVLISVGLFAVGYMLFLYRQSIQQDDGFFAVTIHALGSLFGGDRSERTVESETRAGKLGKHWFWGPAARKFGEEVTAGPVAVIRIVSVFFLVSIFWALFDQHSSSWIRQALQMDRVLDLPLLGTVEFDPDQIGWLNPLFVMLIVPLTGFVIYPGIERIFRIKMTPLKRMSAGMLIASTSFVAVALLQQRIDEAGIGEVHVAWQIIPFILLTTAEVMVSVTGLEFAYTQAPRRMKSTIVGFWLLTVSVGNWLTSVLFGNLDLQLVDFFWLFAAMMAVAGVLFTARAAFYTYKDYTQ